ncbi:hypothetical protein [Bradyrhizobium sp. 2S1]|uniref:hypothetical protein n=1 Tax=Bradyrhizobium sp. 2S1 TaxID=1404429 RepID=UPI00140A762B|nr:hypothetical protein [Bradyrhizobium sp. 2S1]MCK7665818.1 hypothetical protein [Bradyrhizobium sp. 2S1]
MSKFEKPQKGNPYRLSVEQHTFPSKSIARFAGPDGRVQLHAQSAGSTRRAKPTDPIFCTRRAWDHGTEAGFTKRIEDRFQRLAESIIDDQALGFDREQTHTISSFYALWLARSEIREQPGDGLLMHGLLPGVALSKEKEERLEKTGYAFARGLQIPNRVLNGLRIRALVMRYLRENRFAEWGVVHASSGEFLVPDWPVYQFVPIKPTLALAKPAMNQTLDRNAVGLVNKQLRSVSRRYFFGKDLAACP